MLNPIQKVKEKKNKEFTDEDLITIHHDMMCVYGYISISEFNKIPIPTLWEMNRKVQEEKRKREEFRLTMLKFVGVKHPK